MTISDIEKKFDEYFWGKGVYINRPLGVTGYKRFLRSEISALLEGLKGQTVSEQWGEEFSRVRGEAMGRNQATQEFNQKVDEAKQ